VSPGKFATLHYKEAFLRHTYLFWVRLGGSSSQNSENDFRNEWKE
jgi:hypothetical protein